jgi:hypothetical protein
VLEQALLVSSVHSGQRIREPGIEEELMPRAQIKDEKTYRELRKKGESKEKSGRIANAAAGSSKSAVAPIRAARARLMPTGASRTWSSGPGRSALRGAPR